MKKKKNLFWMVLEFVGFWGVSLDFGWNWDVDEELDAGLLE